MKLWISILAMLFLLPACTQSQVDRLRNVGQEPALNVVDIAPEKSAPVTWPIQPAAYEFETTPNSLWRNTSRSFFGDTRARKVGDILKVIVIIQDRAELENITERRRNGRDSLGAPSVFGLQNELLRRLPGDQDAANLLDINTNMTNDGEGIIEREERIETEVAAVVTQVLPNGNLVVYGSQEVRVNFEVRQLTVQGVVRPVDVGANNEVDLSRMAEARVSYGGKGLITDMQQPRIGSQIVDILSPW